MTTSRSKEENHLQFDAVFFHDQVHRVFDTILPLFNRMIKKHVLFHFLFLFIGLAEFSLFVFFLTFLIKSSFLAFSLAILFFTLFSYLILRLYLRTKKIEQLEKIKEQFLESCKNLIDFHSETPEHRLALANACTKFAITLEGKEYGYYRPPKWLDFLRPSMGKYSCWLHWFDVHQMREMMLGASIEEHLRLIKFEPTDLGVHAALANAYVMLSGLYINPDRVEGYDDGRWIPSEKLHKMLEKKFRLSAERAIEEFKILSDYSPDDPWVHLQLAYSYHDLGMPREEIRQYETILRLCPDDEETLFKLGILYFQQGENAKGLQIYGELKDSENKKAQQLIEHYGDYNPEVQAFGVVTK